MKKRISTIICTGVIFVSILGMSAYALALDNVVEECETRQIGNVLYSVSISASNSVDRKKDGDVNISVLMEISTEDYIEIATSPVAGIDSGMGKTLEIGEVSVEGNNVTFEVPVSRVEDKLYVQTPFLTKKSECAITEHVSDTLCENVYNEEYGVNFAIIHFDSNTFSVIPNRMELEVDGCSYHSLYVNHYFSDNGECIGGDMVFVTPDAVCLADCWVKITQELDVLEREVFAFEIKDVIT